MSEPRAAPAAPPGGGAEGPEVREAARPRAERGAGKAGNAGSGGSAAPLAPLGELRERAAAEGPPVNPGPVLPGRSTGPLLSAPPFPLGLPAADRPLLPRRRPRSERAFSRSSPSGWRGETGGARPPGCCAAAAGLRPQRLIRPGPARPGLRK